MAKTRFTPENPGAAHERFESVRARALRKIEEEFRQIKRLKRMPEPEPPRARSRRK